MQSVLGATYLHRRRIYLISSANVVLRMRNTLSGVSRMYLQTNDLVSATSVVGAG